MLWLPKYDILTQQDLPVTAMQDINIQPTCCVSVVTAVLAIWQLTLVSDGHADGSTGQVVTTTYTSRPADLAKTIKIISDITCGVAIVVAVLAFGQ
jgi:hypothetical protein